MMKAHQLLSKIKGELDDRMRKFKFLMDSTEDSELKLLYIERYEALRSFAGYLDTIILDDIVSPFTGGRVERVSEPTTVKYRGDEITVDRDYFVCKDTGTKFTNAEVDDDFMWAVFREHCSRKDYDTFKRIEEIEILKK